MTAVLVAGGVVLLLGLAGFLLYGRAQRKQGEQKSVVKPLEDANEQRAQADAELAKPLASGPDALDRLSRRGPDHRG